MQIRIDLLCEQRAAWFLYSQNYTEKKMGESSKTVTGYTEGKYGPNLTEEKPRHQMDKGCLGHYLTLLKR